MIEKIEGDGNRPLPFDRDQLGRMVRDAWVRWAKTQPNPKPSWLIPYDDLAEQDKEADRQIGEAIARGTLIGDAAHGEVISSTDAQTVRLMIEPIEWFCTSCKQKHDSDHPHPHCPYCGSGYVLRNKRQADAASVRGGDA